MEEWAEEYECWGAILGWTPVQLARHLRSYLTDNALRWYRTSLKEDGLGDLDWPELKAALIDSFKSKNYAVMLARELGRGQGRRPLMEYYFKRREVCQKLGMDAKATICNIIAGLEPAYIRKLAHKRFETVNQLRDRLTMISDVEEGDWQQDASARARDHGRHDRRDRQHQEGTSAQAPASQPSEETSSLQPPPAARKRKGCWNCGRPGHHSNDCWQPQGGHRYAPYPVASE